MRERVADDHEDRDTCADASATNQAAELVAEATADVGLAVATVPLSGRLVVVEAVQADGSTTYWLTDSAAPATGRWSPQTAPHELAGPLPRQFKQRAGLTCAATRTNGDPCRQTVTTQGALCRFHQGGDK